MTAWPRHRPARAGRRQAGLLNTGPHQVTASKLGLALATLASMEDVMSNMGGVSAFTSSEDLLQEELEEWEQGDPQETPPSPPPSTSEAFPRLEHVLAHLLGQSPRNPVPCRRSGMSLLVNAPSFVSWLWGVRLLVKLPRLAEVDLFGACSADSARSTAAPLQGRSPG